MAESNFDAVMAFVFEQEGGFSDLPNDPGGATNFGITHITLSDWLGRPVTTDDVRNMSRDTAKAIFAANYWNKMRCGELAAGIDMMVMDFGVNAGPANSGRVLQKALNLTGADVDGWIGPNTLALANARSASSLLTTVNVMQAVYYTSLHSPYSAALQARETRRYAAARAMIPAAKPVGPVIQPTADELMAKYNPGVTL